MQDTLKGRRIRIEASNSENDRRRGGRMDMNRDKGDRPEVSMGDWRSGPRSTSSFNRDREGMIIISSVFKFVYKLYVY